MVATKMVDESTMGDSAARQWVPMTWLSYNDYITRYPVEERIACFFGVIIKEEVVARVAGLQNHFWCLTLWLRQVAIQDMNLLPTYK